MLSCFKCSKVVDKSDLPIESYGLIVNHHRNLFQNWGNNVASKPHYTFFPSTREGLQNIVIWARKMGKRVRVSGYRHTWTHFFSDDDQVLISLLGNEEVTSFPAIHKEIDGSNPFQFVQLVGDEFKEDGKIKHLCKIGSATTNEQFRTWVMDSFYKKGTKNSWTLPLNVIMVENTIGGTSLLACHGAGLTNKTIADLVTEIEFVNPNGEFQTVGYKVSDPEDQQIEGKKLIKSAAASFGLLGVVTAVTLKLDQLTHAVMKPTKPRLALAIPPPKDFVLPEEVPEEIMAGVTAEDLAKAEEDFINKCKSYYYSEWFWFSLHKKCWVNAWKNNGEEKESIDYPSPFETKIQEIQEAIAQVGNHTIMNLISDKGQATLLSSVAMLLLPENREITTPLIDALHFQRGIQNMKVQDMEFEIPIPALPNGNPDWSICQRAWWDAVVTVYEWLKKRNKVPMRLPLEMRIMGGSDVTMAAQKGNQLGTCSIEILTVSDGLIDPLEWRAFMQAVLNKWSSYTDFQGRPLAIRPHWAKQWEGLTIKRHGENEKEILDYLKEIYKNDIQTFRNDLEIIANKGHYSIQDLKMFSDRLLDELFYNAHHLHKKDEIKKGKTLLKNTPHSYKQNDLHKVENLFKTVEKAHRIINEPVDDVLAVKREELVKNTKNNKQANLHFFRKHEKNEKHAHNVKVSQSIPRKHLWCFR